MSEEVVLSVGEYFKIKHFVIPNYQRGYKWGVPTSKENLQICSVSILMDSLISNAKNKSSEDYYLQGVTVYEEDNKVYLIDGQQRTTTLYLLLKYLGGEKLPRIDYLIRKESEEVLNDCTVENGELKYKNLDNKEYVLQDICYFKKAVQTIHNKLEGGGKCCFKNYLLNNVKLFYIKVDKTQATKVFTMMNGNKAYMKADELIKADFLVKISHKSTSEDKSSEEDTKSLTMEDWEINALRSRYAREWDRWLYWWNREDVKDYFGSNKNPMGLLLEYFFYKEKQNDCTYNNEEKFAPDTYRKFREQFLTGDPKDIKINFKRLRDLQKIFEDWYDDFEIYNYLKLALISDGDKKEKIIYFLKLYKENKSEFKSKLMHYAEWALIGANHEQISENKSSKNGVTKEILAEDLISYLSDKAVYGTHNDLALKQLLRRNVELDNKLERKFIFDIYNKKSLEHIHPQSKADKLNFVDEENLSVDCIGNLVLLSGPDNSSFNNKDFSVKKTVFFQSNKEKAKDSMCLMHSLTVFSNEKWDENEIKKNKEEFINNLKKTYKLEGKNK